MGRELRTVLTVPRLASTALQEKVVVPGEHEQTVCPDAGYGGLRRVTVAAIPSNYGRISFNGYELKVE